METLENENRQVAEQKFRVNQELEANREKLMEEQRGDVIVTEENTELHEKIRLLSRKMTSGVLRVTVHRAELTIDTEMFGKMDPFVIFEMKQSGNM